MQRTPWNLVRSRVHYLALHLSSVWVPIGPESCPQSDRGLWAPSTIPTPLRLHLVQHHLGIQLLPRELLRSTVLNPSRLPSTDSCLEWKTISRMTDRLMISCRAALQCRANKADANPRQCTLFIISITHSKQSLLEEYLIMKDMHRHSVRVLVLGRTHALLWKFPFLALVSERTTVVRLSSAI